MTVLLYHAVFWLSHGGDDMIGTMVRRGGGMKDITCRILPMDRQKLFAYHAPSSSPTSPLKLLECVPCLPLLILIIDGFVFSESIAGTTPESMLVVHLHVDVCESMGANTVNTIAEGLAPHVIDLVGGRVGLKIVTNFCTERRASALFRIPVSSLAYKKLKGLAVLH